MRDVHRGFQLFDIVKIIFLLLLKLISLLLIYIYATVISSDCYLVLLFPNFRSERTDFFSFQIMLNGKTLITMDGRNVVFSVVQDRYVADRHRFFTFSGLCQAHF